MRKHCLFIFALLFAANILTFSKTLILPKKIAKIGDEIILKSDIDRFAKFKGITFEDAKKYLIEEAILFIGAKIYTEEPSRENVQKKIRNEKAFYASMNGKSISEVSDEEFLNSLFSNNTTIETYRTYVKRIIWINNFLNQKLKQEEEKTYLPTKKEIDELIKNKPELFKEKEGALLSMIYFSFYTQKGKQKKDIELKKLPKKANLCLKELKNGEPFENMAKKYSDDLISLNANPSGRVGFIAFDDPKAVSSLSSEIIKELKKAKKGIVYKIFKTAHGLYIFKIDQKINAEKISEEETAIKAEAYLQKLHKQNIEEALKNKIIKELKERIDITIY